jgi:hypothetical protein
MMANDWKNILERTQGTADAFTDNRMLFHDDPLLLRQPRSFLENVIRYGDFTEIVQIAAALQSDDAFSV